MWPLLIIVVVPIVMLILIDRDDRNRHRRWREQMEEERRAREEQWRNKHAARFYLRELKPAMRGYGKIVPLRDYEHLEKLEMCDGQAPGDDVVIVVGRQDNNKHYALAVGDNEMWRITYDGTVLHHEIWVPSNVVDFVNKSLALGQ